MSLSDVQLDNVSCPDCGSSVRARLKDVGSTVRCARGHAIKLEGNTSEIRAIDKAERDLMNSIKQMGGTITFKF